MCAANGTNLITNPEEFPYWILLAHLRRPWTVREINNLLIDILLNKKMTLEEFCGLPHQQKRRLFSLTEQQVEKFEERFALGLDYFRKCVSDLDAIGARVVPFNCPLYSKTLKENLKLAHSPPVLYCKGNLNLLSNPSVAVVGARDASDEAIEFTKRMSIHISQEGKVIVSGFARGVDKQSLESSLEAEGQSIIVLPQGLLTFSSGIKKYSKQIAKGDVLVISTFEPNAGWSTGLAMARNSYIYGLASEIVVAQTNNSGGTWEGAIAGLKKGRSVKIYYSDTMDSEPLRELVDKGAMPIDCNFNPINLKPRNHGQLGLFI